MIQTTHKWMIVTTIMLVAILEVLDSTIVNVALPAMMPSLGANQDQITWVLTSYVVAAAMILPLTGFLTNRLGQKKLLLINIIGFMVSSACCGLAANLSLMVLLRLLQGAFGATLIPTSQAVLRQTFSVEEQSKAMAIWGLGIMVAPVLGPTLGGFITEHANWRWIFYMNIPFCLVGFIMSSIFITETKITKQAVEWKGIIALFLGIGALQLFLDQGNTKNWFDSNFILLLAITSIVSIVYFIMRTITQRTPVINIRIFHDRNFSLCTLALALFCASLFGFLTLEPIMLENVFGYTALITGVTLSSMGLASAVTMPLSAILMKLIPVKWLLAVALLICTAGIFYIARLDLNANQSYFIIGNSFVGAGMGLFMVPLTTYSLLTLPPQETSEGAGLYTYGRMLGSSIGISLLSTLVTRETQINWNRFGSHINIYNNNLYDWLRLHHTSIHDPVAYALLEQTLTIKSEIVAFVDAYWLIVILLLLLVPLVFFLNTVDNNSINAKRPE